MGNLSEPQAHSAPNATVQHSVAPPDVAYFPTAAKPLHLKVTIAWLLGLFFGLIADLQILPLLWASSLLLVASVLPIKGRSVGWKHAGILLAVVLAGACRWELFHAVTQRPFAAETPEWDGQFEGTVRSVPVVYRRPDSAWSQSYGSTERTTFEFQVTLSDDEHPMSQVEVWNVSLDGNARGMFFCGDTVRIQGQAVRPQDASNPGQFDFRSHLNSKGITRQLFVNHSSAIEVVKSAALWSPYRWASWLRADAERIFDTSLTGQNQQLAVAMFLGHRSQLPFELRDAFVASGTMHLLAISGLHVGILSLFVLRIFHLLGVSRAASLIAMIVVVCGYAMVTGFRPSVIRATLFLLLFATSQLLGRQQRLFDLLSLTALIMTIWSPGLLVDTGAWLSFLSVGALAWYSSIKAPVPEIQDVPEDIQSTVQVIRSAAVVVFRQLQLRYRQMLAILLFTLPLTTSEFHVLSPVSLLVNVLLILYTFVVLAAGYLTLLVGVLFPAVAEIPAWGFAGLLNVFAIMVNWAAKLPSGHFYLSDFPSWFLPLWYGALLAMVISRQAFIRRAWATGMLLLAVIAFCIAWNEPNQRPLTVTILDIGHGNATVVECDDRVIIVDSGCMNQGRRAGETVSEFLWTRGWNHIDDVVISHADSDHYNAIPTLLSRFPVGHIITSDQFVRSTDEAVRVLLATVKESNVEVHTTKSTGSALPDGVQLEIFQPDERLLPPDATDNEMSLVVKITKGKSVVILPGDLEQRGLQQLLTSLGQANVLVSPHHGSRLSNPAELAAEVKPALVIVSARDTSSRIELEQVYCDAEAVWWTSETGAVQLTVGETSIEAVDFYGNQSMSIATIRDQN